MKNILIVLFLFIISYIFSQSPDNSNDVMNNYKITATFGDSRGDHFHTGIDLGASEENIKSIIDSELIFFKKERSRSLNYGLGNFVILENSQKKLRINYSHLKDDSFNSDNIYYNKQDKIAVVGNSGHSTGEHLHLEIEDIENKKIVNPINFLSIKDNLAPRIEDVYFITKENEKVSLLKSNKIKRGGKIFIKCMDRIDNSNYFVCPYKIILIIDGKEKVNMVFDYLKKGENSYTLSNIGYKFEELYLNKEDFDYFLMDFHSLPDLIGLKIIVEDFAGNKVEFKKPIRVLPPDNNS